MAICTLLVSSFDKSFLVCSDSVLPMYIADQRVSDGLWTLLATIS